MPRGRESNCSCPVTLRLGVLPFTAVSGRFPAPERRLYGVARPEPPRKSPSPVLMKNSSGLFGVETQTPSARRLSAPTERRGVPAAISSTPRGAGIAGAVGRPASVGVGAVVGIPGTCPLVPGAFVPVPGAFVGSFFGVALTDLAAFVAAFAPQQRPLRHP